MDELISSRASSAPQPGGTPANRDTPHGQVSGVSPLPEGPVPIGSLVFADELPDGVVVAEEQDGDAVAFRVVRDHVASVFRHADLSSALSATELTEEDLAG